MVDESILIVVLYAFGLMLKDTKKINDNFIPIILGVIGIVLSIPIYGVRQGIIQGVLCAGLSVYGNQIYKQLKDFSNK